MNPFHSALDDTLRGRRVRAISNAGTAFKGWVDRVHHHDRHVLLFDATNLDTGDDIGATLVSHADTIEVLDPEGHIERVHVDDVQPSPYHAAEFSEAANKGYVADVRDTGYVGSYPVVRNVVDGLEVVEGHKRLWACRQAGLDHHPVRVLEDVDDWTATRRFVVDHLPDEGQVQDSGTASGCYEEAAIATAIQRLVDDWGDDVQDLYRVAWNADRLDLDVPWRESPDATVSSEGNGSCDSVDWSDLDACVELVDEDDTTDDDPDSTSTSREATADRVKLDTATVKSYGLYFSRAVADFFDTDRVTVRERDGRYELAPGPSDDWPDYAVSHDKIQFSTAGVNVLGADPDTEVTAYGAGNVVILTVDGDERSEPTDGESPASNEEPGSGPDGDDVDDSDDGAPVRFRDFNADPGENGNECQNCGSHVDQNFTRVFEPDSEGAPRVCPNCEDLYREADGTIRPKRSGSKTNDDQEAADS